MSSGTLILAQPTNQTYRAYSPAIPSGLVLLEL